MCFPGGSDGKEFACKAGGPGFIPGSGRSPRARERQCTLRFLPGKFHGQRSLVFTVHEIGLQSMGLHTVRTERLTLSLSMREGVGRLAEQPHSDRGKLCPSHIFPNIFPWDVENVLSQT